MVGMHDSAGTCAHARRNLAGRVGTLPKKSEKSAGGLAHIYYLLLNSAGACAYAFKGLVGRVGTLAIKSAKTMSGHACGHNSAHAHHP